MMPTTAFASRNVNNIKVALIYQFAKFTQWPQYTGHNIGFCSLGGNDITVALDVLKDKQVHQRRVIVHKMTHVEEVIARCQVLFIATTEPKAVSIIFEKLTDSPVFTVGSHKGFLEQGGMINLVRFGLKQRFEVNNEIATGCHTTTMMV
ncbi:MAG: YfiR family protein [Psychrobium sp.]|nr:YfiR family protein [Psychrobium sp.]